MNLLAALFKTERKNFSLLWTLLVAVALEKSCSEKSLKPAQSAFLKFMKVCWVAGISLLTSVEILICIGRWSELSETFVRQSQDVRIDEDAILRSGEVEQVAVILVGLSSLRMPCVLLPSQSAIVWPLASSVSSVCQSW